MTRDAQAPRLELSGISLPVQPDEGEIKVDGQALRIHNPHDAKVHGIAMVF